MTSKIVNKIYPNFNTALSVQALLDKITYKPDWTFQAEPAYNFIMLHITARVVDATCPRRKTTILNSTPVPDFTLQSKDDFYWWLQKVILNVEIHERDEFLRWRDTGKPLNDPHSKTVDVNRSALPKRLPIEKLRQGVNQSYG